MVFRGSDLAIFDDFEGVDFGHIWEVRFGVQIWRRSDLGVRIWGSRFGGGQIWGSKSNVRSYYRGAFPSKVMKSSKIAFSVDLGPQEVPKSTFAINRQKYIKNDFSYFCIRLT